MNPRHVQFYLVSALMFAWWAGGGLLAAAESQEQQTPAPATEGDEKTEPAAEETKPLTNTLKWTTASEVDNFGFDIYRGLQEDGPFERITKEPIPGAGTTDEPQKYVYVDDTNDPTKGYYYYIESISMAGVRERFSPVAFIKPKQPAASAEPEKTEQTEKADEDQEQR